MNGNMRKINPQILQEALDDYYTNIMFNLMSGMPIENLSDDETDALEMKHGVGWKKELGYE